MKLLRVKLEGFGQFNKGLDIAFSKDQLNLIVGRNEAGKSTLLNSIFGVLFGFRDLNQVRRYEPWDDHEAYAGSVELESESGDRYLVRRDFSAQTARIEALTGDDKGVLFEGHADPRSNRDDDLRYYETLGGLLGFKDEAIFRNTVFFGQQSLQTAVSDQIRRMISGSGSMDYKGALHELHSQYSELTTENPWKTRSKGRERLIESTRHDLEAKQDRLSSGREALGRVFDLEHEIEELSGKLHNADSELQAHQKELDALEKLFGLLGRQEEAERRYREVLGRRDNFRRYADRLSTIDGRISGQFSHFKNVPDDFDAQVKAYASDQSEMQKELDLLSAERKRLDGLRPTPNKKNGVTAGALVAGAGVATTFLVPPIGAALGVATSVAGGLLGYNIGRQMGTGYKEERATLLAKIQSLQTQVKNRRKRCDDLLAQAGPTLLGREAEKVVSEFKVYRDLKEERRRIAAAMKALGTNDLVEKEFQSASKERGTVDAALEELQEAHPAYAGEHSRQDIGRKLEETRGAYRTLQGSLSEDRQRLETSRIELASQSAGMTSNLADLEEQVRIKKDRLEQFDLDKDALKEAIDTLDQCIKEFQDGDVYRLSNEISTIFGKITGDKYSQVQLGSSLDPVISRGDDVPIAPTDLSQGAQDQLYFAMRVAMARHLSQNIKLPLFLDDPFVNFDQERLSITKNVLGNLEDHQVIMVTCDRDYIPWTEAVIDLDKVKAAAV